MAARKPIAKTVSDSAPKPAPRSAAKPPSMLANKPAAKPSAKPAAKPAAKTAAKPAAKPAAKSAAKPAAKPAVRPAAKPAVRPAAKPPARPAAKLAVKPAQGSGAKPAATRQRASDAAGPALSVPDGYPEDVEVGKLLLDPQNLRLLERTGDIYEDLPPKLFGQHAIQNKLFEIIKDSPRFDIQALADSIANNGFLKHERLIVAKFDGDNFLVLEGNRRVTAVRSLLERYGPNLDGLPHQIRDSMRTLPCFVLEGTAIDGNEATLNEYRRGSEIYIGMRHLMGAKNWEPASRYEFQSKLILEEQWTFNDVAVRFGRSKREVVRDFQAHLLYQGFLEYEKRTGVRHSLTYNSFAEAARATAILKWLGWSNSDEDFINKEHQEVFFRYLVSRLGKNTLGVDAEGYEASEIPEISAEAAVRKLRDMLRLDDLVVLEALQESDFNTAEVLYEERKEGELPKKIQNFIRVLKRTASEELAAPDVGLRLTELKAQIERALKVIAVLSEG